MSGVHPQCIPSSPEGFGNRDLQCRNSGIKNEKVPTINKTLQRGWKSIILIIFIFPDRATVIVVTKYSTRGGELAIKIAIVITKNNNNIRLRRYRPYYNILLLLNTAVALQQLKNIIYYYLLRSFNIDTST